MVETAGERGAPGLRGAGHRVRALQPAGPRLPHWDYRRAHHLRQRRQPKRTAALHDRSAPGEARRANQALVGRLRAIGQPKGATPAQLALAWLLAQASRIVPIPGTTKLPRLQENLRAAAVELTSGDLAEIDRAASEVTIVSDRYPAELEQKTNR